GPQLQRFPPGRLVCGRTLLSGRPTLSATHHHRHGREPHRTRRHHPNRTAILYLLARTFGSGLCRGGARPLGDRKHAALDSRRHLPRGSVTSAHRQRRQQYGGGGPPRPPSWPPSRRPTGHQTTPQARRLGPTILAGNSRAAPATAVLTSTRCPVSRAKGIPGSTRKMKLYRRLGEAGAAMLLLLAPAMWNGFPFLQYDSGGYLARWVEGYLVPSRSTGYRLFSLAGWPLGLLPGGLFPAGAPRLVIWFL